MLEPGLRTQPTGFQVAVVAGDLGSPGLDGVFGALLGWLKFRKRIGTGREGTLRQKWPH